MRADCNNSDFAKYYIKILGLFEFESRSGKGFQASSRFNLLRYMSLELGLSCFERDVLRGKKKQIKPVAALVEAAVRPASMTLATELAPDFLYVLLQGGDSIFSVDATACAAF